MIDSLVRWCRKAPGAVYRFNVERHLGNRVPGYVFSLALVAVVVGAMALSATVGHPPPDYVAWETDYEIALTRAQLENKPVLIYAFSSDHPSYRLKLNSQARELYFANRTIASLLNDGFVCFQTDLGLARFGGSNPRNAPAGSYGVGGDVNVVFVFGTPWNRFIRTVAAYIGSEVKPPQQFYEEVRGILDEYRSRYKAYAKVAEEVFTLSPGRTANVSFRYERIAEQPILFVCIRMQCTSFASRGNVHIHLDDLLISGFVEGAGDVGLWGESGFITSGAITTSFLFEFPVSEDVLRIASPPGNGFSGGLRCQIHVIEGMG